MRPIVSSVTDYQDLVAMFGQNYLMPPVSEFLKQDEVEYRCPYIGNCPAKAKCFGAATAAPLQDETILNIKCRLLNGKKIPIYAAEAGVIRKKQ